MKSLEKVSNLNVNLTDVCLESIVGGREAKDYSNTWWYKGLDGLGKVAESGSDLWHLLYP